MSNKAVFRSINANDFARAFGTTESEVTAFCGDLIQKLDFRYSICPQESREKIFLDVITRYDKGELSISGAHRKPDWEKGWKEILLKFQNSNYDLETLIPKDVHGDRPMRFNGEYIVSESGTFETDFTTVFRNWLYRKYFREYDNVFEFGCGTGHNLVLIARMFPDKRYSGMDWVAESQQILEAIAAKYGWQIKGFPFDFFHPDDNIKIPANSIVYTSAALEQLGSNHTAFVNYLLAKKPSLCVNVEPIAEYYDPDRLFDYVALKYHQRRNYLNGFLTHLQSLEKENKIKIIATKRLGFGSLYHEAYNYIVWEIL
jgi:hypothetical protein